MLAQLRPLGKPLPEVLKRFPLMKGHGPFETAKLASKMSYWGTQLWFVVGTCFFESDLSRSFSEGNIWVITTFIALVLASNAMFLVTAMSDPGYLEAPEDATELDLESQTLIDVTARDPDTSGLEHCNLCKQTQPLRSRHCFNCGRCSAKWDHHCPFVGNCIAVNNHRYFWVYLGMMSVLMPWVALTFLSTFRGFDWNLERTRVFVSVLCRGAFLVVSTFMSCMAVGLFGFHTYLICLNRTTREVMMVQRHGTPYPPRLMENVKSSEKFPFSKGIPRNFLEAMRGKVSSQYLKTFKASDPAVIPEGHQFANSSSNAQKYGPWAPPGSKKCEETRSNSTGHGHSTECRSHHVSNANPASAKPVYGPYVPPGSATCDVSRMTPVEYGHGHKSCSHTAPPNSCCQNGAKSVAPTQRKPHGSESADDVPCVPV
eukprot:125483_1